MKRDDIIEICKANGLQANRKLGQNFLINEDIRNKIIDALAPGTDDLILEVGPGLGSLTEKICGKARGVTAVEIDSGLVRYLQNKFADEPSVEIIHEDFLKLEIEDKFTKIISNLPYYNASSILFKFAASFTAENVYVMLQREMAARIISKSSDADYGALSVTLSLYFKPEILFNAGGASFFPRPDVTSSFLHLKRNKNINLSPDETGAFHLFVKSAFWGRRKTILRSLSGSPHMNLNSDEIKSILEKASIRPDLRAENLSLEDYVKIAITAAGLLKKQTENLK